MVKFNSQVYKLALLVTLYFCGTSFSLAGGPWTQKKGKGYFKLSEWWVVFDEHFTDAGELDPNVTTGIFNTFLYAEYGLTNRFTAIFNGAIFSRNYMNNLVSGTTGQVLVKGEALNAMGDIDVGVKYRLTSDDSKIPVAASLYFGIPTGTTGGEQGNLQTGDGEFNQIIQLDAGKGFAVSEKTSGYFSLYTAFNNRTEGFSDEFRFGLEYGMGFFNSKFWLTARLFGVESFKNGLTAESISSTSIFANNTEFTSLSLEANYYVTKNLGLSASVAGAFRGEIIAAAPSYSVGVFLDLSK